MSGEPLLLDFVGELFRITPEVPFQIGREGDLVLDEDNLFLHRRFLIIEHDAGLWWVANIGSRIGATITERSGTSRSWILLQVPFPGYELSQSRDVPLGDGQTTVGMVNLTRNQHLVTLALAEPWLRRTGTGPVDLPRNADAAARLGWKITRFNRALDNVCDKLDRIGVKGMRGGPRMHASYRRTALVDYALTARLVTIEDLPLLDQEAQRSRQELLASSRTAF